MLDKNPHTNKMNTQQIDVLNEVLGEELVDQNDIDANVQYLTTLKDVQKCMREYALGIIKEIREGEYVTAIQEGDDEFPSVLWDENKLDNLIEQIEA